jgi:hypothetical protein
MKRSVAPKKATGPAAMIAKGQRAKAAPRIVARNMSRLGAIVAQERACWRGSLAKLLRWLRNGSSSFEPKVEAGASKVRFELRPTVACRNRDREDQFEQRGNSDILTRSLVENRTANCIRLWRDWLCGHASFQSRLKTGLGPISGFLT